MADLASFFEIEAVEVGRREADSSTFLLHTDIGTTIKLVYRFWLLRGPDGITIVDTGVEENEARKRGTHGITPITRALSERGVDPENVQNVILTHLHWDHASNISTFPNAKVWLQRAEAESFVAPLRKHPSIDCYFSNHKDIEALLSSPRARCVEGKVELSNGLGLIPLFGHTPGLQGVTVPTRNGLEVIASDAVPFARNLTDDLPNGIMYDLESSLGSIAHLRELAPAAIYPGHDPESRFELASNQKPTGHELTGRK